MGGWIGLDVVLLYILPVQKYSSKVFSSYFQDSHCQESKAEDAHLYCCLCSRDSARYSKTFQKTALYLT